MHHFADLPYRYLDHQNVMSNMDRCAMNAVRAITTSDCVTTSTTHKADGTDASLSIFRNLEEPTLRDPSKEQLAGLGDTTRIKRSRVTHYRRQKLSQLSERINVKIPS